MGGIQSLGGLLGSFEHRDREKKEGGPPLRRWREHARGVPFAAARQIRSTDIALFMVPASPGA